MISDITFGQFFPSDSFVHKVDPRVKLLLTVLFIAGLFIAKTFSGYVIAFAFLLAIIFLSKVPMKMMLRNLKPLRFIIILMVILNVFFVKTGNVLVEWWIFKVTDEGLIQAAFVVIRLVLLILFTALLTLTTSPLALTNALESLLKPLTYVKFPVHEMAMMMTIALRFIPTLIEETDKIMKAQAARGTSFDTGNLMQKIKSMIPLLIPLFISAFRRADDLALAMTARCYNGGKGRTRMNPLKMNWTDVAVLVGCTLVMAAMVVPNYIGWI